MKFKEVLKKFWYLLWKDESWKGWIFSIIILFIFIKLIFFPSLNFLTGTKLPLAIVESCSMYHSENISSIFNRQAMCDNGEMKFRILDTKFVILQQTKPYSVDQITFVRKYFDQYEKINTEDAQVGYYILYQSNGWIFRQEITNITKGDFITFTTKGEYPCTKGELYNQFNISLEDTDNWKLKNGFAKGDILFAVKAKPEELKIGDIIIFEPNSEALAKTPIIHRIINITKDEQGYVFSTMGDNNAYSLKIDNNPDNIDETKIKEAQLIGKPVLKAAPLLGWAKLIFFEWQKPQEERGFCK